MRSGARFALKLFESTLDTMSAFMNRRSRDYRYVAYVLGKEKEMLKNRIREV
jgi:hypothetical protein